MPTERVIERSSDPRPCVAACTAAVGVMDQLAAKTGGGDTAPVAELGSVFDDDDERPRGPDLRVSVEVPRAALGATLRAPVPARIAADGELVERAILADDEPGSVELHLPEELPDRAVLRLRGHGGVLEAGRAGDLLVVVELVDRAPRDDELITRAKTRVVAGAAHDLADGTDITWWLLLALALLGGGVVAAFAL